ncbi:MFS transporter [Kocuria tytonicola]|uniref:MFS transporter n=1 Tax=Kocuria tytonicola TaxID=2055946 RepID=A0A3L9LE43_9MICC|nr:MFS transporter [Kocuria tytonicola]RLY95217.1 MFS transporter [Kocuria tytonicola]
MTSPTTSSTAPLSRGRRWGALAVLSASLIVIAMDMTILNMALPSMSAELHPSSDQQLWIVDIYSLVLAALLIPVAAVADRWGRKRMLMLGYGVFAAASLLVLVADSPGAVIGIRALLGVGGAMVMPTTLSLIRVVFTDPKERATALSVWAAASGLGSVGGPLVGGFLLEHFSWHSAFLVNVPLIALSALGGLLLLRESRVSGLGPFDGLSAVLSLVGMSFLVWSLKQFGKDADAAAAPAWIALVVAVVALGWFTARNIRSETPLLDVQLFRGRQFSAGIVAALSATFSLTAALLLVAQWLQLVHGASPVEAGVQLIPIVVVGAVSSLAAPLVSRWVGARVVLSGGLALAGTGLLLIGTAEHLTLPGVVAALCLVGAGMGALAIGSALIMGGSPPEKAGNAGALEETAYELGGTLGVTILGSISALVFSAGLTGSAVFASLQQRHPDAAAQARESLGAAMGTATELGVPELARQAGQAFTESLQVAGLAGGVLMVAAAALVFVLTPRGTSVAGGGH